MQSWREADSKEGAAHKKPRNVCPHQRQRSRCKECGASICAHQRVSSSCKECGGAGICADQRQRSACKECGGSSLCPHQRSASGSTARSAGGRSSASASASGADARSAGAQASARTSASGANARSAGGRCAHQRIRSRCKECGGASICAHQRIRSRCKECRVRTTGGEAGDDEAGAFEAGALALAPITGRGRRRSAKRPCSRCRHRWCPEMQAPLPARTALLQHQLACLPPPLPTHTRLCRDGTPHRCWQGAGTPQHCRHAGRPGLMVV